jgi:hypothetical protein
VIYFDDYVLLGYNSAIWLLEHFGTVGGGWSLNCVVANPMPGVKKIS